MPARSDIDPLEIPWMLGDVSLVDVDRSAADWRYRFRLVGSRVVERLGYDMTGKWLQDMPVAEYRDYLVEAFGEVVICGMPLAERPNMTIDHRVLHYEILRMPLAADGRNTDMLLLAVDFADR